MKEIKQTETYMMMGSNIRAVTNFGLWPSNVKTIPFLNKIHTVYCIIMLCVFATFFTMLHVKLFFVYDDLFELMYNLSISLLYAIIAAKISLLIFDRKQVSNLLNKTRDFQKYVFKHPNKKSQEIFIRFVYLTTAISRGFWLLVISTANGLIFPGTLAVLGYSYKVDENGMIIKALPYSCYLPFDDQKHHTAAFFTQVTFCIPGTAFVAIWDTFAFSLITNGICQLKVLQNSLITLGEYGTKSVFEAAKDCVEFHQKTITYIAELDSLLSTTMFLDFVVYAILLCSIGVRAIFDDNIDLPQFVSYFTYLGAVLVQLFMFYWTGNQLMLESVEVASAAFKCNWYNFDRRVQTLLMIMMMRSQKPLKISVGRFYDMNLESLIIILRAWYSYLTLLKQMST